ncbi:MAG: hypothetical protein ACRDT2_22790, partial [Natronosporangium sp.]
MSGSHRRQWSGGSVLVWRPAASGRSGRSPRSSGRAQLHSRVRLTRRGRVVVGLGLLLGGLLEVAALLVDTTPPSQAADPGSGD